MISYQKSEEHLSNARKAGAIAVALQKDEKRKRIEEYYKNPKPCLKCGGAIDYFNKRVGKFCSKSCSASYTQLGRKQSNETGRKKSEALKGRLSPFRGITIGSYVNPRSKSCIIHYKVCNGCQQVFVAGSAKGNYERKTCSDVCHIHASVGVRKYKNGTRKLTWFDNPWQGKVLLESSWEVDIANLLVEKNVKWIRPKSIIWIDQKGKNRHYFPDFYLPEQNMYLDPKNPWGMNRDRIKMKAVEKLIPILYGDKALVMEYIERL